MKYAKLEYPPQGRSLVRTFCRERVVSRGKVFERKKKKKKHNEPTSNWNGFPEVNVLKWLTVFIHGLRPCARP